MAKIKILLIILLSIFSYKHANAQADTTDFKYWITLGGWADKDFTLNLSYSFSIEKNFFKVGYLTRGGFSSEPSVGEDGRLYRTIDISIGKRFQREWYQASLFIGPAFVFGKKKIASDSDENFNQIGLEIETQLLFRLANEVGIGIGFFGNLNFEKIFYGLNINITLGNGK